MESNTNSDDSITFRSHPLERDDRCKTLVKIEPGYMDKLGIKEGDIVKIIGKCTAMAFCFSTDKEELEKAKLQQPLIEYLNSEHKEIDYPQIVMSGTVYSNACPSRQLGLVKLEKLSARDSKKQIYDADVITLGTMKFAESAMPGYKDNIDFSSLFGQIVKEQARINTPFLPDFAQKHQRTSRGGHSHPPNFSSMIVDAKPEGSDFWLVTKNTKFDFQDISLEELKGKTGKPDALSFMRTIPIPHRLHVKDTDIAFTSLEIFENAMKLRWYSLQRIKIPEDIFSNPSKANELSRSMGHESAELTVEIIDDLGNTYSDGLSAGGGGSSGPDPTTSEMVFDHSGEYRFSSTLDSKSKEITIVIKDMTWIKRNDRVMMSNSVTPPKMEDLSTTRPKLLVLEGPWEFKVSL